MILENYIKGILPVGWINKIPTVPINYHDLAIPQDPRYSQTEGHLEWLELSLCLEPVIKSQPEEVRYCR